MPPMKNVIEISRVIAFSVSTRTLSNVSSSIARNPVQLLLQRVGNRRNSLVSVLNGWLQEGGCLTASNLEELIRILRAQHRFKQALQVSDWMTQERSLQLSFTDIAIRLDLISKVHGLERAEEYFENLTDARKVKQVYGALLICYAHFKCLEKAEATMQKMEELGFATEAVPYNVLLKLYSELGKYVKLDCLLQEMQEKGIDYDTFTFNTRLNAYVSASDIEGMQRFLMEMEAKPNVSIDWHTYVIAANGFTKAMLPEQAAQMLKRAERGITDKRNSRAYGILLTMYTNIGNKEEAYRILKLYKDIGNLQTLSYVLLISSLVKLDDLDGAEKIAEEWESRYSDAAVPRLMISAYCKKGLLEKAQAYASRLMENGIEIDAFTWSSLATASKKVDQMEKAVEYIKNALLACQPCQPNHKTFVACLDYLKKQGSVEEAEELVKLLKTNGHCSTDIYDRLLNNVRD